MYPLLLEAGPIKIQSLWLFISVGFVVSSILFAKLAVKNRINLDPVANHLGRIILLSLACARTVFILTHQQLFFFDFSFDTILGLFTIWDKGLSFWGALAGCLFGLYLTVKKNDTPIGKWLDIAALSISVGFIFGSIGTFLGGVSFGRDTVMPWGMIFENPFVKYTVPIHPTQLYALIYSSVITWLIFNLYKKYKSAEDGLIFEYAVLFFATARFLEEFFRGDDVVSIFGLRVPQILAFGIALYTSRRLYAKNKLENLRKGIEYFNTFIRRHKSVRENATAAVAEEKTETTGAST